MQICFMWRHDRTYYHTTHRCNLEGISETQSNQLWYTLTFTAVCLKNQKTCTELFGLQRCIITTEIQHGFSFCVTMKKFTSLICISTDSKVISSHKLVSLWFQREHSTSCKFSHWNVSGSWFSTNMAGSKWQQFCETVSEGHASSCH
jgi:hypothetical protein